MNDDEQARFKLGYQVMVDKFGKEATDAYIAKLESISDIFAKVNVEFPFGDLYSRQILDKKTRALATIAALTVLGYALPQLKLHIKAALTAGATRAEVLEIIVQMIAYCGFPAATNALFIAKEIFDEPV